MVASKLKRRVADSSLRLLISSAYPTLYCSHPCARNPSLSTRLSSSAIRNLSRGKILDSCRF
ncbi:hypothetical protein FB45DRAFT_1064761 [Roridomyces roridus]|uniref:Uncharacterized protein n=1 Tax=Roridomyces roridus TaxID=1738132 RepID=A0AAD7B9W7_9AGAR|nr:hypothetical protein FB45DRAFT_1064761 [Roridomyces roridus]